ncbi:MAG: ATP-binding cassette domain-containing protein [Erysipelotrichaceae bacterium]
MLKVDKISKKYGNQKGIENVSFNIQKGKILGMLGSNGSGKTTTFRILLGLLEKDCGTITYEGEAISKNNKTLFGYLPEERSMLRDLKVKDQIYYLGKLKKMNPIKLNQQIDYWLAYLKIEEYKNRKIIELSKGNQQKVQLVCALIHDPEIIIFDEPFNGLDIENVELFQRVLLKLKKENKTILISSHQYNTIENLCDRIIYLNKGDTLLQGDLIKLKKKHKICYINIYGEDEEYIGEDDGIIETYTNGSRLIVKLESQEKGYRIIKRLMKAEVSDFRLELASLADIIKEKLK